MDPDLAELQSHKKPDHRLSLNVIFHLRIFWVAEFLKNEIKSSQEKMECVPPQWYSMKQNSQRCRIFFVIVYLFYSFVYFWLLWVFNATSRFSLAEA